MYKLGRGGGRGGGSKRPPAPHGRGRGPTTASTSTSIAGPPRGRGAGRPASAPTAASSQGGGRDESFRLESGPPPDFAAIVRLTPDLVEEIRRSEALGAGARIKFNANLNNQSENVIDVGGKEFTFTWAPEGGDLCDIYEQHQNGQDGNGLLVECGSAWRKLNVQRILDESTKNLVKSRTEEAERLSKSRKSIVLDPANPSVKNQAKSMTAAAVEGNMWRKGWKHNKKENFFKKEKKVVTSQASSVAPPKSGPKMHKVSKTVAKGSFSASPMPSSPEQYGTGISTFPLGTDANLMLDSHNEVIVPFDLNKDDNSKVEKEMPGRIYGSNLRASASVDVNTADLRSLLITRLSENPKGMSLKALELVVGDSVPNASKKIEAMIRDIATLQQPGRYLLKAGLEVGSAKRNSSGSRSSQENARYQQPMAGSSKTIDEAAAPNLNIDESVTLERIDIGGSPLSLGADRKVNNDRDGREGSSSESGTDSDSESDSSDSGSDSSRSKSPAKSGSASSSDSESDASSNKEGSDVVVDITSDDDEQRTAHKTVADDLELSSSPTGDQRPLEGEYEQIDIGKSVEHKTASPLIDLNDFDKVTDGAAYPATMNMHASKFDRHYEIPQSKNARKTRVDPDFRDYKFSGEEMPFPLEHDKVLEDDLKTNTENVLKNATSKFVKKGVDERKTTLKSTEKTSKPKLKRSSGPENSCEKSQSAKRATYSAGGSSGKSKGAPFEHLEYLSPEKRMNDRLYKETHNADVDLCTDINPQDLGPSTNGKSISSGNLQKRKQSPNFETTSALHSNSSDKKKVAENVQRPWSSTDNIGRASTVDEGFRASFDDSDDYAARKRSRFGEPSFPDPKTQRLVKDLKTDVNAKTLAKNVKGTAIGDKDLSFHEVYEENGQPTCSQKNMVEISNGVKKVLHRELSELELGEFREPPRDDEFGRSARQVEGNGPSKLLETKFGNSSLNAINRKSATGAFSEQRESPQNVAGQTKQNGFQRNVPTDDFADTARPQLRAHLSQTRQNLRTENLDSDAVLNLNRPAKIAGRNEKRATQGIVLDHSDSNKKKPTVRLQQDGSKHLLGSRTQKSSSPAETDERSKNTSGRKTRDSSSDEDTFFYSKYDKDKPELKGPIKDHSQCKDYMQEYNEKYEAYCYLNRELEKTQDDFHKVGHDLELAQGRNTEQYYSLVEKLRDMYRQRGERHKSMKKVFIILHEELKTIKQRITDFAEAFQMNNSD